jgi:20S proteasome alpha/beta subunit
MTFIASVIANKGVAIIADSLVTSVEYVVGYKHMMDYIDNKRKDEGATEVAVKCDEVRGLFRRKPSHTRDYAEKLFQFDKFTAVTIAGTAHIGGRSVEELIGDATAINEQDTNYDKKAIETKVRDFCAFINSKAKEHALKGNRIAKTVFIFTNYEPISNMTTVYKIVVDNPKIGNVKNNEYKYVTYNRIPAADKVICEGQHRISDRILFGNYDYFLSIIPIIMERMIINLNVSLEALSPEYIDYCVNDMETFLKQQFVDERIMEGLSNLSLQQAVNLAHLLMKIEVNFQKYIDKIPSVGGLIRLAVIDKDGFRFIAGNDIVMPD